MILPFLQQGAEVEIASILTRISTGIKREEMLGIIRIWLHHRIIDIVPFWHKPIITQDNYRSNKANKID